MAIDKYKSNNTDTNTMLHKSVLYEKIYSSDKVDYLLSLKKRYLKKITYRHDNRCDGAFKDMEFLYERVEIGDEFEQLKQDKRWRLCYGRSMENRFGKFSIYELLNKCGSLMPYYKVIEKPKRVNGTRYPAREIFYKRKM